MNLEGRADGNPEGTQRRKNWQVLAGTWDVCARRLLATLTIQEKEHKGEFPKGGRGWAGKETKRGHF